MYKQSRRREGDTSIVNGAFRICLTDDDVINDISMVFGGVSDRPVVAENSMKFLKGKKWSRDVIDDIIPILVEEVVTFFDKVVQKLRSW